MSLLDRMRAGLREATGLVRSGNLTEATQAIQRALRGAREDADGERASALLDREAGAPTPGNPMRKRETEVRIPATAIRAGGAPVTAGRVLLDRNSTRGAHVPGSAGAGAKTQFFISSYSNSAGSRKYKLFVPGCYQGQALPLIVMLHGCTQTPDDFAAGTGMNRLAEEKQCFVAYPAQTRGDNAGKCWNWFKTTDQQRDRGEPSIIAGITVQIMQTYSVDAQRVYVAGLSAGGAMAAIMALTYPDLYAAAGVHSGVAYAVAHDPASAFAAMKNGSAAGVGRLGQRVSEAAPNGAPIPLIVFHGDKDTTVHPRNAQALVTQWNAIRLRSREQAYVVAAVPQVTIEQGQVPGGHAYTRALHHASDGQVVLELWEVHGAGHAWAGGSPSGSHTDAQGPDATTEMMRFFYQHQRGGAA